eukprot:2835109-Rhodomonas_salina.3
MPCPPPALRNPVLTWRVVTLPRYAMSDIDIPHAMLLPELKELQSKEAEDRARMYQVSAYGPAMRCPACYAMSGADIGFVTPLSAYRRAM